MNAQPFGKYQLLKKLATGGMAEVWLARQTGIEGFQRMLVLKRILPHLADDPEFVQMFLNEAKIAARFNHPNIAQIYDLGEMSGTYFIAMEFVHGEDLGRVMRKAWSSGQWIARPLSIRIVAGACEGLHYAHSKTDDQGKPLKVVHRDISPQNILISFDGSVKLVDFGIAKAADQASLTKSGAIKGKFAYMSPEQAAGKPLDNRSDVFSIGLVLYELLTGVRPLKRDSELATLQAALECSIEAPSKVADVPEDVDAVVMKALAKAADDRYRDARQFQMALEEFLVAQRWVASSVQISELMGTLFADRLDEEAKLGHPDPEAHDSSAPSGTPMAPLPPEGTDRTDISKNSKNRASDQSWDAPPGKTEERRALSRQPARTMSRGAVPAQRIESGPHPEPPPDVPAWDAPAAVEPPRRRSGELMPPPAGESTALARTPSRPDLRLKSEPEIPRRPSNRKIVIPSSDDAGIKGGTGQVTRQRPSARYEEPADNGAEGDEAYDDSRDGDAPDEIGEQTMQPLPPSRSTSVPRRSGSQPKLADSPKRGSKSNLPSQRPSGSRPAPKPVSADDAALDEAIRRDEEQQRKKSAAPARPLPARAIGLMVVVAALALFGAIFRKPIVSALTHRAIDGQSIFLSVDSNQPVHVLVRHAPTENAVEPVTDLGTIPLRHVSGAHVRDTLILKLESQDIYYEQEIPFGEPGSTIQISKQFHTGHYVLNLKPDTLKNLSIRINGQEWGSYPPAKLELMEGTHRLILQGDQLTKPAEIEADVKPNETTIGKRYDLTPLMRR